MHTREIQGHLAWGRGIYIVCRVDVNVQIFHTWFDYLRGLGQRQGQKVVFLAVGASRDTQASLVTLFKLALGHYYLINVLHVLQSVLELMKTDL